MASSDGCGILYSASAASASASSTAPAPSSSVAIHPASVSASSPSGISMRAMPWPQGSPINAAVHNKRNNAFASTSNLMRTSSEFAEPSSSSELLSQPGANGAVSERATRAVQQVKGLVAQALQQQQQHAVATQSQLQTQVQGLSDLLRSQARGLMESQRQIADLQQSMIPSSSSSAPTPASPQVIESFEKLGNTQKKIVELHCILANQLGTLEQMQTKAQDKRLDQTKSHVCGLFNMMQDQTIQLDQTQAKVEALEKFAQQAQVQVKMITSSHETKLQQTSEQVQELHDKLEQQQAVQASLQKQLSKQEERSKSSKSKSRSKSGSQRRRRRVKSNLRPEDVFPDLEMCKLPPEIDPAEANERVKALTTELAQLMILDQERLEDSGIPSTPGRLSSGHVSDESC